jgi:hypothetical protein
MPISPVRYMPLLAMLCSASALAQAPEPAERAVVLIPVQDTTIFSGSSDSDGLADGMGESLWLSVIAGGLNRRLLLRFDMAAIPKGSKVLEVSLSLYESRARDAHPVRVHRLLESWGEGTSNAGTAGTGAPAQPGDATWVSRFHPDIPWSRPGGLFVDQASATTIVGLPNQRYAWTAQRPAQGTAAPALLQDVQGWIDSPASNHGWILVGQEDGLQNAKRFGSRTGTEPPRLAVRYQEPALQTQDGDVPLPAWALVTLVAALAAGLARRRQPSSDSKRDNGAG